MSDPMQICMAYVTASNRQEAEQLGRALVEERLAACVNILGEATSIYYWDGALCEEAEVVFIAKTTRERVDALCERVVALHGFDTPCVSIIPVEGGFPVYQDWVRQQVRTGD